MKITDKAYIELNEDLAGVKEGDFVGLIAFWRQFVQVGEFIN